ncbi:MAG: hypothetical protein WAU75_25345 [Solirubrobacteraceae bacterium]
MSVTTPTLKLLGDTAPPLLDALVVAAPLDDEVAALDEVEPPPAAALELELEELLLPHAASAKVATTPTVHVPR